MNYDPFYHKIEQRLSGRLDPYLFEKCADDLLRKIYPTLVPIRGGHDAGMDGVIADSEGRCILVVTTGNDAAGNLRRNLDAHIQSGRKSRRVIFATSRVLTERKRANLDRVASECGFTLIQVHDGADFADRLYREPKWCRDLLRLSGDPCPLSVVPRSERPLLNTSIVGREEDAAWLRETKGDRLLVGQPGSGKTFLLQQLAKEGWGLFVISRDLGAIADGIREQEPTGVCTAPLKLDTIWAFAR